MWRKRCSCPRLIITIAAGKNPHLQATSGFGISPSYRESVGSSQLSHDHRELATVRHLYHEAGIEGLTRSKDLSALQPQRLSSVLGCDGLLHEGP